MYEKLEDFELTRLIGFEEVREMVGGLSRTTIRRYERQNLFPKRVKLGEKRVAWRAREVEEWMASRTRAT